MKIIDSCFNCDEFTEIYDQQFCKPCYDMLIDTLEQGLDQEQFAEMMGWN